MLKSSCFLAFVAIFVSFSSCENDPIFTEHEVNEHFERFKIDFKRSYPTVEEEANRREVFERNLDFITRHNREFDAGRKSFSVRVNKFADLSREEFRAKHLNQIFPQKSVQNHARLDLNSSIGSLPDSIDWTTKGVVSAVKDQGGCTGAGFAFSVAAAIEGQHALKTGQLVDLSAQNLVDCTYPPSSDDTCEGFYNKNDDAFEYVISNQGIDTDESYPYEEMTNDCHYRPQTRGATITAFVNVPQYDEAALQNAVATIGPISATIDAVEDSFQFYYQGVYYEPKCDQNFLTHFVTVVGYGSLNGTDYWKVKNSWGTDWGNMDAPGYILMARNRDNNCGIATMASYPLI